MEDLLGDAERLGTEEHPAGGDEVEGDDAAHDGNKPILLGGGMMFARQIGQRAEHPTEEVPDFVEAKKHAVDAAPQDEVEGGSVPKATEKHGHEQVEVLTELAVTVAAQGDVEVVLEPGREADVPTPPELGDGGRLVGAVEVLGELESEQEGDADGHVGIARKVAVNLEGVAIDGKEIFESAVQVGLVENTLDEVDADIVGNDGFLEESGDDVEDTRAKHGIGDHERAANLWDEVAGTNDGACHQLREETDVEGIIEQPVEGLDVASIDIDGVTQRLEGEEGNAHRQEDVTWLPHDGFQIGACDGGRHVDAVVFEQSTDGISEEIGVLEKDKKPQVEHQREENKGLSQPAPFFHAADGSCDEIVGSGHQRQQPKEKAAALIVEIIREEGDEKNAEGVCLAETVIDECES